MDSTKKSIACQDNKIKELEEKVEAIEKKVEKVEKRVEGKIAMVVADYKALVSFFNDVVMTTGLLATRIFTDLVIAKPFFRAMQSIEIEEKLEQDYDQLAFLCGKRKMQTDVRELLAESLHEDNLAAVHCFLLDEDIQDPNNMPEEQCLCTQKTMIRRGLGAARPKITTMFDRISVPSTVSSMTFDRVLGENKRMPSSSITIEAKPDQQTSQPSLTD
nr:uncharacterized protein LOC109173786 [Ipomoea batatas]